MQFEKLLVLIANTGGAEVLQAYLAPKKINTIKKKRPNVLVKRAWA